MTEQRDMIGVDVWAAMTVYVDADDHAHASAIVSSRYAGTLAKPDTIDMLDGNDIPLEGEDFISSAITLYGPCGNNQLLTCSVAPNADAAKQRLAIAAPDMLDLLHRNFDAWDNEEDSVKEEHSELIAELSAFLDIMPSSPAPSSNTVAVMLAALRAAEYQLAEEVERRGYEDSEYDPPMTPVLEQVRAAIAKAEGKEG